MRQDFFAVLQRHGDTRSGLPQMRTNVRFSKYSKKPKKIVDRLVADGAT
jgi:hypothetical protein